MNVNGIPARQSSPKLTVVIIILYVDNNFFKSCDFADEEFRKKLRYT